MVIKVEMFTVCLIFIFVFRRSSAVKIMWPKGRLLFAQKPLDEFSSPKRKAGDNALSLCSIIYKLASALGLQKESIISPPLSAKLDQVSVNSR